MLVREGGMSEYFDKKAADKLAYHVAVAIANGWIATRSAIDDALLNYLEIGGVDGPTDVPTWIDEYEKSR